jgi:hypothetical protein
LNNKTNQCKEHQTPNICQATNEHYVVKKKLVIKTQINTFAVRRQVFKQQQKLGIGPNSSNNNAHKQNKNHKNKKPLS